MNRIDEEEEDDDDDDGDKAIMAGVDQFPSARPPPEYCNNNNVCSSKQTSDRTDRTKYQTTNRSTSLPSRQSFSSSINIGDNVKQRRRYASDSNTNNNNNKNLTTSLVNSFLQYLRSELRATTNNKRNDFEQVTKQKSSGNINCLSQTFHLSNDFHRQQYPIKMSSSSSSSSQSIVISSTLTNENVDNHTNDDKEILTLINLLILRVECLANENTLVKKTKKKKRKNVNQQNCPTIKQVDHNLIEYLYYLFNKFINDESELTAPMIDKTNFVNVCQTLVRNGCFNMPSSSSPDQSVSESTITNTNSSDLTLNQTFVREYRPNTDDLPLDKQSENEQTSSVSLNDEDTWLVVDLEPTKSLYSATTPDQSECLLPSSTSDGQLLLANENYFSFDEPKSCESESSHSNYYSPNSSLVDLQNMVQEFDEINNNNNNNLLFNEDGLSSIDHGSNNTNVIIEAKDTTSNNNICTGLTNDCIGVSSSNEQVASSSMETTEQRATNINGKMSRRERKMQERWTITTKNDNNNTEQSSTKVFLGVEFPPIAVLRRKFSSSPPPPPTSSTTTTLNALAIKKKDSSSIKSKTLVNKNEINNPSEDNIDKSNNQIPSTTLNPSIVLQNQEINTSISTTVVNETNHDQIVELQANDAPSSINYHDGKNNDEVEQALATIFEFLSDENDIMKTKQEPILLSVEPQTETVTNTLTDMDQYQQMHINNHSSGLITDSFTSNLSSSCSLLLSSISPSTSTTSSSSSSALITNTNENRTIELLPKEIEEEKKEDDDNVDVEKKNNCSAEHNYHASGIILINDEPTQAVLLEQEKKEKKEEQERERTSSPLPTLEQCNQQRPKDESPVQVLSHDLEKMTMAQTDENEQLYKTVEIEDIPDDEDIISVQNSNLIEPTDYIHTDDEPRILNTTTTSETSSKFDTVLSCYEKALAKLVEKLDGSTKPLNTPSKESQISSEPSPSSTIKSSQRPEDDPIALRALERFEQRMNAAAVASVTDKDERNVLTAKGKSSWSGTLSTPRKSLENLFKNNQPLQSTSISTGEESTTAVPLPPHRDTFIRPRKSMLDDNGLNFGMTLNLFGTVQTNLNDNNNHKLEDQQQSTTIIENDNKRVVPDESTKIIDYEDHQQPMMVNSSMTNENGLGHQAENSNSLTTLPFDSSLNTVISRSSSSEQQSLAPYRHQIEGRRRLNTLERIRERHQNHDSSQHYQLQSEYTIKPEEFQDPIIRRALERFDEKSRSLAQSKPTNYDEIQDPITRRALMRLETNLKRTIPSNPPTISNHDADETWFTNSYTLGSLQSANNNRLINSPDSSLPPTSNNKTSHISVHQRFSSTSSSSDMPELPATLTSGNILSNNEHDIPVMRVPTQPVYVTSNNQQPINFRQRSRSEDMISSKDLSIGQTTNVDDDDNNNTSQLQRNHSSNELQQQTSSSPSNEVAVTESDHQVPSTLIKSLDPNFVRTAEASVNYATPTQTYSAYSCEYTRPHQNQLVTSPKPDLSSPRNTQQNELQYSTPSSSAFAPVHPSTNNYYSQQPLPTPSYSSMYTSNNLNQTPYSDDPIVRRALERFNSQMQNSLMSMPQHQSNTNYVPQHYSNTNYMPRQYSNGYLHQGNFDSSYSTDQNQYDPWINSNRSIPTAPNTNSGYQSIIGRRRQIRHDDVYHDHTSVGNGYSSSLFLNSQNPYSMTNHYMNLSDEPPVVPPRFHRDNYHEQQQEYLSENINNNNNNAYIHHAYPVTTNGFRSISHQYIPSDSYNQFQEEEYLRHRAQSTSSTTSSDSVNPIRLIQQRLPPTSARTHLPQNKKLPSDDNSQLPSGQTTPSNGSATGDSVFHRLAYTNTKASLSKSSSNLCANLLNKNSQQPNSSNNIKTQEIDFDDSPVENTQEQIPTPTNNSSKCQRSRSVDGRARIKNAQMRTNNGTHRPTNDYDENNSSTIPSSKFTSMNTRRDAPPPRVPIAPRSVIPDRSSVTKRVSNGHNLTYTRNTNGIRGRGSNGNLVDTDNQHNQETDNDENLTFNENYQPKIIDSRTRTSIPVHRYTTNNNNNIQPSASTSSVNSTISRTKIPIPTSANLDRRDSNGELNRSSKRSDDNRILSPIGQRRNIPVSVFAPAKLDNKRPAPAPPSSSSPTNDPTPTYNPESQQQTLYSSTGDSSSTTIDNENAMNNKLSSSNSTLKSSTGNLLSEFSLATDKHDTNKKMNVFERLFRGNKKKV